MSDPVPASAPAPVDVHAKSRRSYIRLARVILGLLCFGFGGTVALGLSATSKLEEKRIKIGAVEGNPAYDSQKVAAARKDVESRLASVRNLHLVNMALLTFYLVCFVWSFFKPIYPFALAFAVYVLFLGYRFGVSEETPSTMLGLTLVLAGCLFLGAKSAMEEKAAAARSATSEAPRP